MSAGGNWRTPAIGDVVLLTEGFEGKGQHTGPHYGLVVACFKVLGSHDRRLLIAPGSSLKNRPVQDQGEEVLVMAGNVVGRNTVFYFNLLTLYTFPSEAFQQSNVVQQKGVLSSTKGGLQNLNTLLGDVRIRNNGNMVAFYKKVLKEDFGIDCSAITGMSQDSAAEFLK